MDELLFLAHRIPYPPNKGDKIRAWHILKHLTARYRVRLGCLIDDPHDRIHVTALERHCAEVMAVEVMPGQQRRRAIVGLRPGQPLSNGYFRAPALMKWVKETVAAHNIREAFVFSSPMMTYVPPRLGLRTVLDMVDVDSEKWRDIAQRAWVPKRWINAREAKTLLAFERRAAAEAAHTLFCSEPEAALFVERAPEAAAGTRWMVNGIDTEYFSPGRDFARPYSNARPIIAFTGDMGYWPNVDAVLWFARAVLPRLLTRRPNPRFAVVGAHPTKAVRALAGGDVIVTGRVDDVRPYLLHASVVVAPLLIARGIQNKVLEGMAMGKVVVATSAAEQGLGVRGQGAVLIADDADAMAERVAEALDGKHAAVAEAGRRIAETRFGWAGTLGTLDRLLANPARLGEERVA